MPASPGSLVSLWLLRQPLAEKQKILLKQDLMFRKTLSKFST